MTTSIFSGRSRHRSSDDSSRSKIAPREQPRRRHDDAEKAAPDKPTLEELRRKRLQYLALSPQARRRLAGTSRSSRSKPKETVSIPSKPVHGDHEKRKRRHRAGSGKPKKDLRVERITNEDYVYDTRSIRTSEERDKRRSAVAHDSQRPHRSSRRHTLPVLIESEDYPDDDVSQAGARRPSGPERSVSNRPSYAKRDSRSYERPKAVLEQDSDANGAASTSRVSRKAHPEPPLLGLLRRNTAPAVPTPPRLVECLTCAADDVPHAKSAKLSCGHRMCFDCLRRVFEMSVKDPAHMPPKCCTDQHIPLQHVDKLFDVKFKKLWNRKYQEYHTKNRIYCPASKCGEWIKPNHVRSSHGRKYAQCPRCQTRVCTLCNGKLHRSKDCPKDPEIAKLVEQAKEKGWQSCFNCNAMVELKEGCNHMTCRCRAEFCMICGAKWKTCECPWFNYNQLPDPDRLMEWRVPEPIQNLFLRAFPPPPPAAPTPEAMATNPAQPVQPVNRQGPRTYGDELEQRQRQERLDADLARRLQLASLLDPDEALMGPRQQRNNDDPRGPDNAADQFMNDDFVQNAANVIMGAFGDAVFGRRGERSPARRRRPPPREAQPNRGDGIVQDFLGDESIAGASPPRERRENVPRDL